MSEPLTEAEYVHVVQREAFQRFGHRSPLVLLAMSAEYSLDAAMEFGYLQCEKGHNIQMARINLVRLLTDAAPPSQEKP